MKYLEQFLYYITYETPKLDRVLQKFNVKTIYKEEAGYKFLYGIYFNGEPE